MFRDTVTIPQGLLKILSFDWRINWRNQSSGEFMDGATGTHFGGVPRWEGQPTAFLSGRDIAQWAAIRDTAQGKRGLYRVPMADPAAYVHAGTGATRSQIENGVPLSVDTFFSDGTGFGYEAFAVAVGSTAAGASTIRVDVASCGDLAPVIGQIMSAQDWPFRVTSVTSVSGTQYDLTVQRLRVAINDGDFLPMRGVGLFEAVEAEMGATQYGAGQHTTVQLGFIEALRR